MEHRIAQTCGVVGPQYKCVNGAWVLLSHADPADGGRAAEPAGTVAPIPMAARLAAAEQQTRDVEAKEALTRRNTANDVKGRIRAARAARLERQHARDRAKGGKVGGEPDLVPAAAALPPPHAAGSRDQGGGDHRAGSAGRVDTDLWLKQGGDWVAAKTSNTLDGTLLAGRPQLGPLAPLPPPCRVRSPQLRGRHALDASAARAPRPRSPTFPCRHPVSRFCCSRKALGSSSVQRASIGCGAALACPTHAVCSRADRLLPRQGCACPAAWAEWATGFRVRHRG